MNFKKTNYKEILKKITKLETEKIKSKGASLVIATKLENGTYELKETLPSGKTKKFTILNDEDLEVFTEKKKNSDCIFVIDDILFNAPPRILENITKECTTEELKTIIEEIDKNELGEIPGTPLTDKIIFEKSRKVLK